MVEKRLKYNEETLGPVGFSIYKQSDNGSLSLIDFVTEKKYTYKGYGNTTLVIKAEHKKYKSNEFASEMWDDLAEKEKFGL